MQIYRSATTITVPRVVDQVAAGAGVRAFVFGDYRLDLSREELIGPRGTQVLRRKSFATLRMLLDAAPAVLSLDSLLDTVWGRHAISPSAVPNVIVELRHALGDTVQSPRYIETRHRRGYRVIATVARERNAGSSAANAQPSRTEAYPLLNILDEIRRTSAHASPRRQLELLHQTACEHGLTFLALQAQLALQTHPDGFMPPFEAAEEQAVVAEYVRR